MKYVDQVLQPGETLVYATSLHWLVYMRAVVLLVGAIILLVVSGAFASHGLAQAVEWAAGVLAIFSVIAAAHALIQRATTELAVTDRRVIYKRGIFQRHTMEMNRSKVETVGVDQSILGRMLNYGTVIVRGTGGSLEPIRNIADPLSFRNHITAA